MQIVSFSVLSSVLGNTRYLQSSPYLNFDERSNILERQFEGMISRSSLIALQEWGLAESCRFSKIFTMNNYFIFATHTGPKDRDRVATAIAIPLNKYKIIKLGYEKISNHIIDTVSSHSIIAKQQYHEVSYAFIESDEGVFVFFNVHMPQIVWPEPIMILLGDALRRVIDKISGNLPIVLAGNFNAEYGKSLYNLMVGGNYEQPYPEWNPPNYKRTLKDSRAVYDTDTCTVLCTLYNGTPVREIYDFIFVSNFYTISTNIQYSSNSPNAHSGSNHFPIIADLSLKDHKRYVVRLSKKRIVVHENAFNETDTTFILKHSYKELITLIRISKIDYHSKSIMSIETGEEFIDHRVDQIYVKCNGYLPPVMGSSYAVGNTMNDAPTEISNLVFDKDKYYYLVIVSSGSRILKNLIINA